MQCPSILDLETTRRESVNPFIPGESSFRLEALGLMTAGIVHDLGNLIQIASSSVEIIDQHPAMRSGRGLQPAVARATRSLERAGALIGRILNYARPDGADKQSVDLSMCLADIEQLLEWVNPREIKLQVHVARSVPTIFCNRWSFENALLNLALNARDAMPAGGVLSISAVPYGTRTVTTGVELSVSDTGQGMSPQTLARAFDPFFTTKPRGRGTGLGLSMVRQFAEESGGRIMIESEVGRGTKVILRLPLGS
jgi:signal transduction histidine kinase